MSMAHRRGPGRIAVLLALAAAGALAACLFLRSRRPGAAPARALSRRVPVTPADAPLGEPGRNQDLRLDEALKETFPASDPVSIHIERER
jgi:hypothetical protein